MIHIGISQCLLGANVRFDGGHRNNKFCTNELAKLFEFTPLCPEVGIGLPIPRKTIRLVGDPSSPRAVQSDDNTVDYTNQLQQFANTNKALVSKLSGYIFCKASPSCGVERVKVYNDKGYAQSNGMGVFSRRLKELFPLMPMEEDGRLNDPLLRDSFIKRVYIYNEWKILNANNNLKVNDLLSFHSRHKMTLLAHCHKTYRTLGPLVASARASNISQIAEQYITGLMSGLKNTATRSNNTNVLMHLQGHLKKILSPDDKAELTQCIIEYRKGLQPILSPITLLRHHFKHHPKPYIDGLSYFEPYPKQLAIRVSTL